MAGNRTLASKIIGKASNACMTFLEEFFNCNTLSVLADVLKYCFGLYIVENQSLDLKIKAWKSRGLKVETLWVESTSLLLMFRAISQAEGAAIWVAK